MCAYAQDHMESRRIHVCPRKETHLPVSPQLYRLLRKTNGSLFICIFLSFGYQIQEESAASMKAELFFFRPSPFLRTVFFLSIFLLSLSLISSPYDSDEAKEDEHVVQPDKLFEGPFRICQHWTAITRSPLFLSLSSSSPSTPFL